MKKRAILLILDSLGVGAMDDVPKVRPRDVGADTFRHILDQAEQIEIPNLEKLGINQLLHHPRLRNQPPLASWGTLNLQHEGADSYAGHQEIMGTRPRKPVREPFVKVLPRVKKALQNEGYRVEVPNPDLPYLWVNPGVVIGDNIETDYGQIYNVSAALDVISFAEVLKIGKAVREEVRVNRVIALGGEGISPEHLRQNVERREDGLIGLNSPKSGVYRKNYQARHLGYGVDPEKQIPTLLVRAGWPVHLIGKMQDVITCEGAETFPGVDTDQVMRNVRNRFSQLERGLIAATVQETDLAGHAEDVNRYARKIMQVDRHLGPLLDQMGENDLLLISADHGNDPTAGHSQHTREKTFILSYNQKRPAAFLGHRSTLSDIAATLSQFFRVPPPENGTGFYKERK
ncbi:phosphopentomutase [Kroppenstedtia eburnea]|uniref:Phosphopentomutase n=1 Tax=Kroppenstedtia eburnea TaxID=714067 RepID=A0A1N7LL36_9BACL|nr:phosphopentomutase [Kroppenstedtia eburnea]QKI81282.1 phosphopentomutase [Kroppenstedtia eburnea]SIS74550.1 Phosphopentomutase [Kroppenstedtia eburnea]